jgi:predicted metalloprotease with PDZ domain
MLSRARLAWCVILLLSASPSIQATVRYTVTLTDPVRHIVEVSMEVPAGRDAQELQLPVWNALYQIRDFVQFMDSIKAADLNGNPLPLAQLNKGRWRLTGAATGARIEYRMFSDDPGPYGSELTPEHAFFNLAEILLYADDTRADEHQVAFDNVPTGWNIVTSLSQRHSEYLAKSYDDLVDAPVEIGKFGERDFTGTCGKYRVIVDAANAPSILSKIIPPIQKIVNSATSWMDDCPFQVYTFIYHFSDTPNGGGMEHAYSTAITLDPGDLEGDLERFTSMTAHEFFHLWNVKRIRPQALEPADYTRENYTNALWFSEGVDTTAADSVRLHAGIVDEASYLDHLSQAITELENRPAHLTQSAEQSSLDAWLEKYPYFAIPERSISYYNKGELLGVLLDLKIKAATHGKDSLQTLFRWMNEHYAKVDQFFPDSAGVLDAAEKLTGTNFHEFFSDYVSGVREIPWDTFFVTVGLHVTSVDVSFAHRGFKAVKTFDRRPTVVRVEPGSEAEKAGLKADDEILSINGIAAGRNFEQQIEALGPGATLQLQIRRDGAPKELHWKLGSRKVKIYRVENLPSVTPEQTAERKSWLFGDTTSNVQ